MAPLNLLIAVIECQPAGRFHTDTYSAVDDLKAYDQHHSRADADAAPRRTETARGRESERSVGIAWQRYWSAESSRNINQRYQRRVLSFTFSSGINPKINRPNKSAGKVDLLRSP